jgi:hypothetical protein
MVPNFPWALQEYIDDVAAAQGTELVALKASEVTLPWLHTSVSARLGGAANVPQVKQLPKFSQL